MRYSRNIEGLCPHCKEAVTVFEPKKFVYWGDKERGLAPMWRVAHVDCEDHYKPLPEPECFAP